jgi:hypothetical protein
MTAWMFFGFWGALWATVGYWYAMFNVREQKTARFLKKHLRTVFDDYEKFIDCADGLDEDSKRIRIQSMVEIYRYLDSVINLEGRNRK